VHVSNFIARRYLFAKKSIGVINVISLISATGIAIGCAALIIILSVYNGFDSIILQLNNSYTADLSVSPVEGKVFDVSSPTFESLRNDSRIKAFCEIVEENVFLQYDNQHLVATAKGVDSLYEVTTALSNYLVEGKFNLAFGEIRQVVMGRILAMKLGLSTSFLSPLKVFFPSRTQDVDILNPLATLHEVSLFPGGIVSLDQNFDGKYLFMPLQALRELLEYSENQVTSVELYLSPEVLTSRGFATKEFQKYVEESLGDDFVVKNKQQQNEMLYRLLLYEKIAIYLILVFVMIIISFNIFCSLSMLIIEKREDIEVLRAMGASDKVISRIFVREGWLICLIGIGVGIGVGLIVCLLQQWFGFVKMPGHFIIDAYPIVIKPLDILITVIVVASIGYFASALSRKPLL